MSTRDALADRFEHLARHHADRLMGYLLRRVNAEDVADVAAETMLTAWRRIRVMPADDEEALWWLLGVARRTAANYRRGVLRRSVLADRLRTIPIAAEPADAAAVDERLAIQHALNQLASDDQELLRLIYWDDLPIAAAAVILNLSEPAARKRLQRARNALRSTLAQIDHIAAGGRPSMSEPLPDGGSITGESRSR